MQNWVLERWFLDKFWRRFLWNSKTRGSVQDLLNFFSRKVQPSRVFHEKSSIFFSCQGLVEICSKMRSFVDILILGHPLPPLPRGAFTEIGHFWNFAVGIYIGNFKFLKKFPEVDRVWGDLKSKYQRKTSFLKRSRLDLCNKKDLKTFHQKLLKLSKFFLLPPQKFSPFGLLVSPASDSLSNTAA